MEDANPVYHGESERSEMKAKKMSPWLIVLLVVVVGCVALVLVPICIIAILALSGPAIGNVFSNIVVGI